MDTQLQTETLQAFTEKNPHISEPMQFKPVWFEGQLCGEMITTVSVGSFHHFLQIH